MSSPSCSRRDFLASLAASVVLPHVVGVRAGPPTLAERLGYARDTRLLILHADDLGLLHSVNVAGMTAFQTGVINSGSIMVPCPWFPEFADFAKSNPALDLGLHLTLTCERPSYRWGPVLGPSAVPSLVDADGFFPVAWPVDRQVNLGEVEAEIRAQIARARHFGVEPTHLDSHEHYLQQSGRPVFDVLLRVAGEMRLPVRVGRNWFLHYPYLETALGPNGIALDRTITIPTETTPDQWIPWYQYTIRALPAGVTEIFVHVGYDDGELRAYAPARLNYGATWRQRDLDAMTSAEVHDALTAGNVKLITWREIGRLLRNEPGTPRDTTAHR